VRHPTSSWAWRAIPDDGRVVGARFEDGGGARDVAPHLVGAADGARSRQGELSGLPAEVSVGGFAGRSYEQFGVAGVRMPTRAPGAPRPAAGLWPPA
jgi:hypothetical protein